MSLQRQVQVSGVQPSLMQQNSTAWRQQFIRYLHNARRSFCYIGSAQGRPFFNTEEQAYETDV